MECNITNIIECIVAIMAAFTSVVAICISVRTAHRQNKIALFDKRYNSLFKIYTVLRFAKEIEGDIDRKILIGLFDASFGTNFHQLSKSDAMIQLIAKMKAWSSDILQAKFLFDDCEKELNQITDFWMNFMMKVVRDVEFAEEKDIFCKECAAFYQNKFSQMKEQINLKKK